MFLFLDLWKYMNFNCTNYLTIALWLEAEGIFQNAAYGTSQVIFTSITFILLQKINLQQLHTCKSHIKEKTINWVIYCIIQR